MSTAAGKTKPGELTTQPGGDGLGADHAHNQYITSQDAIQAPIEIAINRAYKGKLPPGDPRWQDFNDSFEVVTVDANGLAEAVQAGHAYTAPHKRVHQPLPNGKLSAYRHSSNFLHAQHMSLDFDTGDQNSSFARLVEDTFIRQYAAFLYTTASHKPEAPRSRAVFILDQPIMDAGDYADASAALVWKFTGQADSSCKDAARLFFGAPNCGVQMLGGVLPLAVVKGLVGDFKAAMAAEHARMPRPTLTPSTPQLQEIADALRCIPAQSDYFVWLSVLMAVHAEYPGTDGISVCEQWSPGYPGEIERKFASFSRNGNGRGRVGIGTLFYLAQQNGWVRPAAVSSVVEHRTAAAASAGEPPLWPDGNTPEPPEGLSGTATSGEHLTDLGNARRLVAQHGQDLRFCHPWAKWLVWTTTHWSFDDTGEPVRRAKKTVASIYAEAADADEDTRKALAKHALKCESDTRIRAMLSLTQSEPGIPVLPGELDADRWLLNVLNGTLDLRTGQLREHRRQDLLTKLAPVAYDPTAICPTWLAFLGRIMADNEELITFVQRAIGYALTGDTSEQVLFVFWGTGANGKSTLLETLRAMLGDEYALQIRPESLMVKQGDAIPNDIARLKGARLVNARETEEGKRLAEALVKELVGGDTITARFLRAEYFDFKPEFKLFLAANHKPVIRGTDYAIWRRIRLIPFTVTIPADEQDKDLLRKLQAELPGILAWAVRGCLDWQSYGLGMPAAVRAATDAYRAESDILAAFLDECTIQVPTAEAQAGQLYEAYKQWAVDNGEHPMTGHMFGRHISERGFDKYRKGNLTYYIGLGLVA